MDIKVKLSCQSCDCKFELTNDKMIDKDEIKCPNCGQPMPVDVFEQLKTGLCALSNVPNSFPDVFIGTNRTGFTISIEENPNVF